MSSRREFSSAMCYLGIMFREYHAFCIWTRTHFGASWWIPHLQWYGYVLLTHNFQNNFATVMQLWRFPSSVPLNRDGSDAPVGCRCVLIPLSRCRNRTWEVVSFTDCCFGASPSLITRNVNCLPVNFFQIPVLLPPLCICLYPILDLTLSSLFRYPGRICGRAELNSASKVMMLSLDLSFPSNFNEALVLLTSCPSRAALKFKLMLKY